MLNRPEITEELILQIKNAIKENPGWKRTKISRYLCELWDWRMPDGQLKDISCRDMLRSLDKAGKIALPKATFRPKNRRTNKYSQLFLHDETPIEGPLSALQPLRVEMAEEKWRISDVRFLILEWVRVPHLASHILSLVTRRISADWNAAYGHSVHCLETFVERDRFRGVCYRAANWINVGQTTGRGRNNTGKTAPLPIKDIYLYPLHKRYKDLLRQRGESL